MVFSHQLQLIMLVIINKLGNFQEQIFFNQKKALLYRSSYLII